MSSAKMEVMWDEAVRKYEQITKKRLGDLTRPHSAEDLIQQVQSANSQYKSFREKSSVLFKVLSAIAKPIELVGDLAAGAASAAFPPSSMVFGAAKYLIQAAEGVSAILDAISDLMSGLQSFCIRLKVYERADLSKELSAKLTEILVTVIEILARSTKKVQDPFFRVKAYAKNVLLGNDKEMQDLLDKLDDLTRSEDLLVGAETYVEVKSTGKGVQNLQASVAKMQVTADESRQGIISIKAALDESAAQSTADRTLNQLEALKNILDPSATAQEKFEQIKRERRLVPHSGDWILTEEALNSWTAGNERPLLWITGNPGSGKSFLTYNIVTGLHDRSKDESNSFSYESSVGFFFFQDNSAVTQSFRQALCDVAYQLTQNDPTYSKYLRTAGLSPADLRSVSMAWKVLFEDYWLSDIPSNVAYIVLDGLDEASSEQREMFIELLQGIEDLGAASKLRVAMLGRPHIVQEMTLLGLREPPSIYVDSTKNGADIGIYVRSSIAKSQALKRISKKLQAKIIQTLTKKAGGMFMWAKLMIAELNRKAQRSRESEVEKVLNEAPKSLTDLIRHVLEGFAVSLPPDEAEDLNIMLRWVALAQRPLYLGELDAALRLKTEDGAGLVFLEGMLRKTYASLFTLSRDDGMTTSDLLTQRQVPGYDDGDESESQDAIGDGEEDLDYPAELNSNPKTTTVAFSHASISDYFLNPEHGQVIGPGDRASAVGVDLGTAHFDTVQACIDIMIDETYRKRMEGAVSLQQYAKNNWFEHLERIKIDSSIITAHSSISKKLAHMLYSEADIAQWAGARGALFFTSRAADVLMSWLRDPAIVAQVDSKLGEWLNAVNKGNSIEIFYHTMQYVNKQWVGIPKSLWSTRYCPQIVHCWLARRKGETVDSVPTLTVNDIVAAAQFGGFEENAEFQRRVAMSLRDHGHYKEAKERFEKAFAMDSSLWLANTGIAIVHYLKEEYQQALDIDKLVLDTLETCSEKDSSQIQAHINIISKRMGDCYSSLANSSKKFPSDTALELDVKACQHYYKAWKAKRTDYLCASYCSRYWQMWANFTLPYKAEPRYTNPSDMPAPDRCFKEIMSLAHELEDTHVDSSTYWLWNMYHAFEIAVSQAAKETGELPWLQERFSEAISRARKVLKPAMGARMVLCLANLCDVFIDDGEKAMKLWESIASERALTAREQTDMVWTQQEALRRLSEFCLRKALEDEDQSGRYIEKLEKIWKRSKKGVMIISEESIPAADFALSLGSWYAKLGHHQEALEAVKAHVREALALLSDDDPTNDVEGYLNLGAALLAVRDDTNATALMHSLRDFRHGVAVLSSDLPEDKESDSQHLSAESAESTPGDPPNKCDEDDNDEDDNDGDGKEKKEDDGNEKYDYGVCSGPCDDNYSNFDNTFTCRSDLTTFCTDCYAHLCRDGSLFKLKCSPSHEFFKVGPLTTRFKKGEIVVDGVVTDFTVWKQGVAKKWGF